MYKYFIYPPKCTEITLAILYKKILKNWEKLLMQIEDFHLFSKFASQQKNLLKSEFECWCNRAQTFKINYLPL